MTEYSTILGSRPCPASQPKPPANPSPSRTPPSTCCARSASRKCSAIPARPNCRSSSDWPDDIDYVLGLQEASVDRHGRRLCAGHPQRRLRQSAFGGRRRQCARQYLHRPPQPDAAGDHRRPAGALASCRCRRFSMPSARRNFRGPMSNTASSRRAPKTCRPRSRAPITWRCSRPAGRPSSRCRSTTGPIRRKPIEARQVSRELGPDPAAMKALVAALVGEQAPCPRRRPRRRSRRRPSS